MNYILSCNFYTHEGDFQHVISGLIYFLCIELMSSLYFFHKYEKIYSSTLCFSNKYLVIKFCGDQNQKEKRISVRIVMIKQLKNMLLKFIFIYDCIDVALH